MNIENTLKPYGVPENLIQEIRDLIALDSLTGLYNRRFFEEALTNALAVAERYKQPLSLILLDIDDFKSINDRHGYTAGDQALKTFAQMLNDTCREADIVCRYGGDEFAVILTNTTKAGAIILRERIQSALPPNLQASAGIAAYPGKDLFLRAETEMRKYKK
ncbi:GGDEF domain-containing protein [Verrucomicrobiota bacterium]